MTFGGGGGLLLDVSVKIEMIDFLQPRITRNTCNRCCIHFVHPSLPFARMMLGACFGLGIYALDMAIKTTIRGSSAG